MILIMSKICSCSLIYTQVLYFFLNKFFYNSCFMIFEKFCRRYLSLASVNLALMCLLSGQISMPRMLPHVFKGWVSVLHLLPITSGFLHLLPIISGFLHLLPHPSSICGNMHDMLTCQLNGYISTRLTEADDKDLWQKISNVKEQKRRKNLSINKC